MSGSSTLNEMKSLVDVVYRLADLMIEYQLAYHNDDMGKYFRDRLREIRNTAINVERSLIEKGYYNG